MKTYNYYWVAEIIEKGNIVPTRRCTAIYAIPHKTPTPEDLEEVQKSMRESEELNAEGAIDSIAIIFFSRLSD